MALYGIVVLVGLLLLLFLWRRVLRFFITMITAVLAGVFLVPCLLLILIYMLFTWIGRVFGLAKVGMQHIDRNHKQVSEISSNIAKASRVVAGFGGLWAWLIAPSGFTALGVSLGIASTPLIVTLSPVLIAFAGAAYIISAGLDLYSKWREKSNLSPPN